MCAVVATALAQIFTNTYQKSLDCNAMQLLYHTSPLIALVRQKKNRSIKIRMPLQAVHGSTFQFSALLLEAHRNYLVKVFSVISTFCSNVPEISFNSQGMIIMCPFFDDIQKLTNFQYTMPCVMRIGDTLYQNL